MIPYYQTLFGECEGDCFRTCVESLLELPLATSPNFCAWDSDAWFQNTAKWLSTNTQATDIWRVAHQDGAIMYQSGLDLLKGIGIKDYHGYQDCLVIQDVMTPRGLKHSIISQITMSPFSITKIHDPYPGGGETWAEHKDMDTFYAVVANGLWVA